MKSSRIFFLIILLALLVLPVTATPVEYAYGAANASSNATTTPPWYAFDNLPATYWQANVGAFPQNLSMNYNANPHVINTYTIKDMSGINRYPTAWTIRGGNGSVMDILDTKTGEAFTDGQIKTYRITNSISYRWYSINITACNAGGLPAISEMELVYEDSPISSFTQNATGGMVPPYGIQFNDTSVRTPDMWNWSINASLTSVTWYNFSEFPATDTRNMSALFTTVGDYQINLTVSNTTKFPGTSNTSTRYVFVNATLTSDFGASPQWSKPNRSISFVDMSSGGGLYNWSWQFGDYNTTGTNRSYVRNPTKTDGYQLLGNYNINLTVKGADGQVNQTKNAYIRINMNNTFTLVVRDADTFQLITTPDIVKLSQAGIDYKQNTTANGVVCFELPDGAYDVMAAEIAGEYNSNIASVTMAGSDATGTIYLSSVSSGTKTTWYTPWQVRIQVVDYYSNPLPYTNITAYYIASTLPNTSVTWLTGAYGISASVAADMLNSGLAMGGITDSNGGLSFTMFKSINYNISIVNATSGVSVNKILYPTDQEYRIRVPLASQLAVNNTLSSMSLTSLPVYVLNSTAYNLSLVYLDTSGLTTNVRFQVLFRNGTYLLDRDEGNPGTGLIRDNFTVWSPTIGDEIVWRYNATRSSAW